MIQAFIIEKKLLDLLTNELHATYSFAGKEGVKNVSTTFPDHLSGNAYLKKHARDWFMTSLEDYVKHKLHIIEAGNHQDQLKEWKICQNAVIAFEKLTNENICSQFLKGFEHFVRILPSENNPSYKNSLHNLNELKRFCENYK